MDFPGGYHNPAGSFPKTTLTVGKFLFTDVPLHKELCILKLGLGPPVRFLHWVFLCSHQALQKLVALTRTANFLLSITTEQNQMEDIILNFTLVKPLSQTKLINKFWKVYSK